MKENTDKIDDAALALLYLTMGRDGRAWKQIDWDVTNRLHEKGLICDLVGKAKSLVMTEEGAQKAKALYEQLFCEPE